MRWWLVALTLSTTAVAGSKSSDVEQVIKGNLTALAAMKADDQLGFTKDPIGIPPAVDELAGKSISSRMFFGAPDGRRFTPTAPATIGVDDAKGYAWFQVPYTADYWPKDDAASGDGGYSYKCRLGGVAVRDGKTWRIAAAYYGERLKNDRELIDQATRDKMTLDKKPLELKGDKALAAIVAGWVKTGFATHAAKTSPLIASGTSPSELGVDAAALTLVKSWDKLGLVASSIEVTKVPGTPVAFAEAWIALPIKKTPNVVYMNLAIVMVPDGSDWRWVSLQYAP